MKVSKQTLNLWKIDWIGIKIKNDWQTGQTAEADLLSNTLTSISEIWEEH